ncbi:ATP-dependent DNA ligase [Streptomyces sp. NPDC086081]
MQPDVVMEVAVDVARDAAGRWRYPVRPHRVRTDLDAARVPLLDE